MSENAQDIEIVEYVVKQIVESPEEVEVNREVDEMGVLLTLKVAKDDMGKIIGKSGQTAKALRTLLRIVGSKNDARVNLKIVEPEGEELLVVLGVRDLNLDVARHRQRVTAMSEKIEDM